MCNSNTGTQLARCDADVNDPQGTAAKMNAILQNFPGIKIFATGKWRQKGLQGMADVVTADIALLSQEDEGTYSGLCTGFLMNKIYNIEHNGVVLVVEGGGGSTQMTSVVFDQDDGETEQAQALAPVGGVLPERSSSAGQYLEAKTLVITLETHI